MQLLCNKNLGKIGCSAVLKVLTSNNDTRIELHRTVRILIIDRRRVVSACLCVVFFGIKCAENF